MTANPTAANPSAVAPAVPSSGLRSLVPIAPVLGLAVVAGATTVALAQGSGAMAGAMGLGLPAFAGMWAVMMAAMMLPSTAPVAARYARTIDRHRVGRVGLFTTGYLTGWAVSAVPAYGLMLVADRVAAAGPIAATATASAILAACGGYQLTPLKDRCLRVCRAPFGLVLRYAGWQGRLRDLRVGAHHGAFCLGCCWALMALLAVFGAMSLTAMAVLMGVVAVEKLTTDGRRFARAAGVVALVLAVAVWWMPGLAAGLHPDSHPATM